MKDIGKQLNEIVKSLLRITELNKKIEKIERKLVKKWLSYAE
jgi:hypothetical protein